MKDILNRLFEYKSLTKQEAKDVLVQLAKGKFNNKFKQASDNLYGELAQTVDDSNQLEAIKGMFIRINLTFERSASKIN